MIFTLNALLFKTYSYITVAKVHVFYKFRIQAYLFYVVKLVPVIVNPLFNIKLVGSG